MDVPWPGSSVGQRVIPIRQRGRFDSWSGHMQESSNECLGKWNSKLISLSPSPLFLFLCKINLKKRWILSFHCSKTFFFYIFMTLISKSVIFSLEKTIKQVLKPIQYLQIDGHLIYLCQSSRAIINAFCKGVGPIQQLKISIFISVRIENKQYYKIQRKVERKSECIPFSL